MGAMTHTTQAVHGHMQDHESHVLAVEADLEYWRTKRLEPRVLQLQARRWVYGRKRSKMAEGVANGVTVYGGGWRALRAPRLG